MADNRAAQLRAGAARSRKAKRQAGLRPREVWVTDEEWRTQVKPLLDALAATRAPVKATCDKMLEKLSPQAYEDNLLQHGIIPW